MSQNFKPPTEPKKTQKNFFTISKKHQKNFIPDQTALFSLRTFPSPNIPSPALRTSARAPVHCLEVFAARRGRHLQHVFLRKTEGTPQVGEQTGTQCYFRKGKQKSEKVEKVKWKVIEIPPNNNLSKEV